MILFQIGIFCVLAVSIVVLSAKNVSKWAAALQRVYDRDIKKAFGNGWFSTPSLLMCKIHVICLVILAILIVFNLCFGTIYL